MLQAHALNISEKSAHPNHRGICVHVCIRWHVTWVCIWRPEPTLSVSVLFYEDGSLAEPRTRLVASKPQRSSCPFPQFWVTGLWLHPGELGWFGGGGCCYC